MNEDPTRMELANILEEKPPFLIRWGITVLWLVALALSVCYFNFLC